MNMRAGYPVKYTGSYYVSDGSYIREEAISEDIKRLARGEVVNSDDIEITYKDGEYYAGQRGSLIKASISEAQALAIQGNSAYEKENDRLKNLPANTSVGMGIGIKFISVNRTTNKSDDGKIYETYGGGLEINPNDIRKKNNYENFSPYIQPNINRVDEDYISSVALDKLKFNVEGSANLLGSGVNGRLFDDESRLNPEGNIFWGISFEKGISGSATVSYITELKSPMNQETLNIFNNKYSLFASSYGKLVRAEVMSNPNYDWDNLYINKVSNQPVIIVIKAGHYQIYDVVGRQYYPISRSDFEKYYEKAVVKHD